MARSDIVYVIGLSPRCPYSLNLRLLCPILNDIISFLIFVFFDACVCSMTLKRRVGHDLCNRPSGKYINASFLLDSGHSRMESHRLNFNSWCAVPENYLAHIDL